MTYRDDEWIKDEDRAGCADQHCKVFFSTFQRRSHCRSCGEIFCHQHLEYISLKRNVNYDAVYNKSKVNMIINDEECVKMCGSCKQFYWYFVYKVPTVSHELPYLVSNH